MREQRRSPNAFLPFPHSDAEIQTEKLQKKHLEKQYLRIQNAERQAKANGGDIHSWSFSCKSIVLNQGTFAPQGTFDNIWK